MLLQLHQDTYGVEVRQGDENTRHAGAIGVKEAQLPGYIHGSTRRLSSCPGRSRLQTSSGRAILVSGGRLTTVSGGSTASALPAEK